MIRKNTLPLFFIVSLQLFIGFSHIVYGQDTETRSDKYLLTPDEFESRIEKKNIVILDVRTPTEYSEYHIPGAINVDYKNENFEVEIDKLDKGKKYFIYCRTGKRSANSRKIMNALGIRKVYDLDGGITAWKKKEYPVEME